MESSDLTKNKLLVIDNIFIFSFLISFVTVFLTWNHNLGTMFFFVFSIFFLIAIYVGLKYEILDLTSKDYIRIISLVIFSAIPLVKRPTHYFFSHYYYIWYTYGALAFFSLVQKVNIENFNFFNILIFPLIFFVGILVDAFKIFYFVPKLIKSHSTNRRISLFIRILTGFIIALPLVGILIYLLGMINPFFHDFVINVWETLFEQFIPSLTIFLKQVFVSFIYAGIFFPIFYNFVEEEGFIRKFLSNPLKLIEEVKQTWDPLVSSSVLFTLNVVFFVFLISSIRFYFSKHGLNYSEAAHEGFIHGVIASLIIYVLLFLMSTKVLRKTVAQKVFFMANYIFTLLSGFVVVFSGFVKLIDYEHVYGLTTLRFFVHVLYFVIFIFYLIIFILLFVKINAVKVVNVSLMISLFCVLLFYTIFPVRAFILKYNFNKYMAGELNEFDIQYNLHRLYYSSIDDHNVELAPVIIEIYKTADKTNDTELRDESRDMLVRIKNDLAEYQKSWRSYNIRANNYYAEISKILNKN